VDSNGKRDFILSSAADSRVSQCLGEFSLGIGMPACRANSGLLRARGVVSRIQPVHQMCAFEVREVPFARWMVVPFMEVMLVLWMVIRESGAWRWVKKSGWEITPVGVEPDQKPLIEGLEWCESTDRGMKESHLPHFTKFWY